MKKKALLWSLLLLLLLPNTIIHAENGDLIDQSTEQLIEPHYRLVLNEWEKKNVGSTAPFERAISPTSFENIDELQLLNESRSNGYNDRVVYWDNEQTVSFEVEVDESGLYEVGFDYYPLGDLIMPIEGAIKVNGEFPYFESRRIVFPVDWENEVNEFELDRYNNEIVPNQKPIEQWYEMKATDAKHFHARPLQFYLEAGKNIISLTNLKGEMLLGSAYITSPEQIPNYEDYISEANQEVVSELHTIEAEHPLKKNSSYIRPFAVNSISAHPYDTRRSLLNTFGGESWSTSGDTVTWEINVEEEGYYHLSFKAFQDKQTGAPVFRTIYVNDKVPFQEVEQYRLDNSKKWYNETVSDENGNPYKFYLNKGTNTLTLKADASPFGRVIFAIEDTMRGIEELSLSIRKLTGNQLDQNRDWNLGEYLPGIEQLLLDWANRLDEERKYLNEISGGKESTESVSLKISVDKLKALAAKPDEIPFRMSELSEGSNSAAQLLGTLMIDLQKQPLLLDRIYAHGDEELPPANAGIFARVKDSITNFFLSFNRDNLATSSVEEGTVEIWVNRPRQFVDLMQHMLDQKFTPETGIEVKLSLMPDESKLILASAANSQPDLALGISNWLPYELAIRGAAVDLRQFDGFEEVGRQFSPGAFLPLIVDDSIYALPETQDFFVQFYRKDILNSLNIPVPDTWDDVISILPELQRYGLNYYTPIAGAVAFKPFQTTAPYIYQFGGDLYKEDGIGTTIDSEESLRGIQFMAELNTIYSTPLQVPNFYNHFRYSTLPIGIGTFSEYVQLTAAAPEISGWWDISLHPGVKQEDGSVARWATGSAQASMIFEGDMQEEAWEVLKWWTSTETQVEYARSLQTLYGPEYMWNTANLNAFKQLPWPDDFKDTILEQWEYLREVPKTPYAYMVEREISNVWNKVVFDGENIRSAVDDSVITIDREMRRKLEEFGYMENGKVVKPYMIPTIEKVERWLGTDNEN
ncbi:extracellular solute-binding protein [Sutcliffiella sp. NC1]|uniref:extracellular solute-binding protein n=1 Tax=Sutcliffiella sp. NC1 TaxID=3004096 RepID=UPI0022DDDCB9|nr:extracellular solute-binding protein [Sutcliffiella sp. NC1]WBL14663.1 extracellular solute-binding protein [Sutcliffiella sp. NC1]